MRQSSALPLHPEQRLIVSVFDYTGEWARPYAEAGYPVLLWDYKVEGCILERFDTLQHRIDEAINHGYLPYGLLAAPPCTEFSSAGAQYWPKKDATTAPEPYDPWTLTELATALVGITLHLRDLFPWAFWAIENPPGRLERCCPELAPYRRHVFSPFHYGDPYTKKTILYGCFNDRLERQEVKPQTVRIKAGGSKRPRYYNGSALWNMTGGTEKSRTLRSKTPAGFAQAFFNANR